MNAVEFRKLLFHPKTDRPNLFGQLKISVEYDQFFKIIDANLNHPATKSFIYANALPKKYEHLRQTRFVPHSNLIGELAWSVYAIRAFKKELNSFITFKQYFEDQFLLGEYEKAALTIDQIESSISKSLWSIENRLLLSEYKEGVESNWATLSDFSKIISDPLLLYFVENYSKRAESKITYFRFKNLFNNQISEVDAPDHFKEYLCFRLNYPGYVGFENYSFYLTMESISPIIDRYLLTRDILIEIIGSNNQENKAVIEKPLRDLVELIESDNILKQLVNFSNSSDTFYHFTESKEILQILDEYTKGNFSNCITTIPNLLKKYPSCIELYEVYVKSLIETGEVFILTSVSPFIDDLLDNLFNLFSRNARSEESTEKLLKIILSFYSTTWAKQLFGLLCTYNNINREQIIYKLNFILNSKVNNPRALNYASNNEKKFEKAVSFFEAEYGGNKSYKVNLAINKKDITLIANDNEISVKRKSLYIARTLYKLGELDKLKLHYEQILNTGTLSASAHEEVIEGLFNTYTELKLPKNAITLFVDNYLLNQHLVTNLNREIIIQTLEETNFKGLEGLIDLPIFYNVAIPDSYKQYVAYDTFLSFYGFERPSQLIEIKKQLDERKYIYFLKEVSTSEVLHHSYFFEGTEDVENERLRVLRELILTDRENENIYIKEITEITQNSTIRKAIQEVNKGRITVNIQQLKSDEANNIKEGFSRYQELSNYSKNKDLVAVDASSKMINDYLSSINEDRVKEKIVYTNDPAFITFKLMFLEMRDKFILSKEYGLDGYLSTRIRHGTLLNHIRSVFETSNLLCQKGANNEYFENAYWGSRVPYALWDRRDQLQKSLKQFSKDIDDFTELIIKDFIQVKTEKYTKKPNAFFDYSINQTALATMFAAARNEIKDYSVFIDFVFTFLEERTRILLEEIRKQFLEGIKEKYNQIIQDFQQEVKNIIGEAGFGDLTSSIAKCSTNIQDELRNISEWFYLSNPTTSLTLDLSTVIQTSLEITNSIYPTNKIHPKSINIKEDFPIAVGSINLIYIIKMLLENIIVHCGLTGEEKEVIIATELSESDKLILQFTNRLSSTKNIEEVMSSLTQVKESWVSRKGDFEKLNIEGGSGFDKIRKILAYDMIRKDYEFDFYIKDDSVTIEIKFDIQFSQL